MILEIDRTPVASGRELWRHLEDADAALLLVARGETTIFLALKREGS